MRSFALSTMVICLTMSVVPLTSCQGDGLQAIADFIPDLIAGSNLTIPPSVTFDEWALCRRTAEKYAQDLLNVEQYALDMFDATSKLPDGILNGNTFSPGNWDQCLSVRIPSEENFLAQGQYCAVNAMSMPSDDEAANATQNIGDFLGRGVNFYLGVCVPSSCPKELLESSLNEALNSQGIVLRVSRCLTDEEKSWTGVQIFGITFLSLFALLVTTSTLMDIANRHFKAKINTKANLLMKMLDCFSIYTNTEKFLQAGKASPSEIGCLHGMRFITISWIILGHVYSEPPMYDSSINKVQNLEDWFTPGMQLILNSTMSVDTFFTMSGFLVSYGLLKTLKKSNGAFPLMKFYVHRYICFW